MTSRLDAIASLLRAGGVLPVLADLNCRVPHRYTAVYQVRGQRLRNLFLIDKQGEIVPRMLAEVPMDGSFCQFVIRDGVFATEDSAADRRLDGHPAQGVVVAYTAVPIVGRDRVITGTLCHFDRVRQALATEEFELMQQVALLLPDHVPTA